MFEYCKVGYGHIYFILETFRLYRVINVKQGIEFIWEKLEIS